MKYHLILGLLVAPLAGLVGQFSAPLGLVGWVVFLTWAAFFATSGGKKGLLETTISAMLGLAGGYAVIELGSMSSMSTPLLLPLVGAVFVFVFLGQFSLIFPPAAFLGCAAYLGAGALPWETFISLILGVLLGYITEMIALKFASKDQ